MNVLLLGSGGREHALAVQIVKSPLLGQLFAAPGNPGIAEVATCIALEPADATAVVDFCRVMDVGFVVVGPEAPLVAGLVDALAEAGIKAFGPRRAAAQLEGSKGFTKDLCTAFAIPTAAAAQFSDADTAKEYIRSRGAPIVVKADGLASGKGVVVAQSIAEAEAAVDQMLGGLFGAAGQTLVIEDFLDGEEVSFFALCDGKNARAFASAQDHKRVGEGDTGPNTGGMGAYSPAPVMDEALLARVMDEIINPALRGMAQMGTPFPGRAFRRADAHPRMALSSSSSTSASAIPRRRRSCRGSKAISGADACLRRRPAYPAEFFALSPQHALTIVLAAEGYPGTPKKGTEICGARQGRGAAGRRHHAGGDET